ncbi:MAG: type II toxin-antitoxin system RelB/DinJ family antitoxin [Clostridia bacterium]|nr:type II toxin-antitoxin system RelB/DinJ family antitoxin [Clostridia bacterium]HCH28173.1 type II toxin-antitoxin system antitoxin, RelB/DinJ family [Oscillospiraceae bacterium]
MAKVSTNVTIDETTKKQAQVLLADFGMDLSTAVNIFLKQMVYEGSFPFSITREVPNTVTLAAMKEIEEMKKHPEAYKTYKNVDKMVEDILGEV